MTRKARPGAPHDLAHFSAFDTEGQLVLEVRMTYGEYYDESHPLIDSDNFRTQRRIRRVTGQLFNSRGTLTQEFENHYASTGELARSTARHDDGTVTKLPD